MEPANSLASRLIKARSAMRWSQEDLSAETGIAQSQLSGYEKGVVPRAATIAKLADALGVPFDWLKDGVGDPGAPAGERPARPFIFEDLPWELQRAITESAQSRGQTIKDEIIGRLVGSFLGNREER